jgi:hypothetical protein
MNGALALLLIAATAGSASDSPGWQPTAQNRSGPIREASVRMEPSAQGAVLVLGLPSESVPVAVGREGGRVVVEVAAPGPVGAALPPPLPPVTSIAVERGVQGAMRVVMEVPATVGYQLQRRGREIVVEFGAVAAPTDFATLVAALFPEAPSRPAPATAAAEQHRSWLSLRPSVSASYMDGTVFENGPRPTDDSYFEVQPKLDVVTALPGVHARYEARVRRGSRVPEVDHTVSHLVGVGLEKSLAGDGAVGVDYSFVRGRQETLEVDPGAEYFYNLEPFYKHDISGRARVNVGGATSITFGGGWNQVRFDQRSGFTDYASWTGDVGLSREIAGSSHLELTYGHTDTYDTGTVTAVGTTADALTLGLSGELRPRLTATLGAGYSREHSPRAPAGARSFDDIVLSAAVRKQFSDVTAVGLNLSRTRTLSAFAANPSYLSSRAAVDASVPLPWRLAVALTGAWLQNEYPLPAPGLDVPRRDRLLSLAGALGHPIGSHVNARVEYHWERRTSNLALFTYKTHVFLAQVDVVPFRGEARK